MITAEKVRQTMIPSLNLILNTIELHILNAKDLGNVCTKYEVPYRATVHVDAIVQTLIDHGFRVSAEEINNRDGKYFEIMIGW